MPASLYNFNIEQGSSFRMTLVYKDDNGNAINITGWCARLIWTTNKGISQTFSTDNVDYSLYKFIINGSIGQITFMLPASVTNGYDFREAKYDLELQSPNELYYLGGNETIRLLNGTITLVHRYSGSNTALECQ